MHCAYTSVTGTSCDITTNNDTKIQAFILLQIFVLLKNAYNNQTNKQLLGSD